MCCKHSWTTVGNALSTTHLDEGVTTCAKCNEYASRCIRSKKTADRCNTAALHRQKTHPSGCIYRRCISWDVTSEVMGGRAPIFALFLCKRYLVRNAGAKDDLDRLERDGKVEQLVSSLFFTLSPSTSQARKPLHDENGVSFTAIDLASWYRSKATTEKTLNVGRERIWWGKGWGCFDYSWQDVVRWDQGGMGEGE